MEKAVSFSQGKAKGIMKQNMTIIAREHAIAPGKQWHCAV